MMMDDGMMMDDVSFLRMTYRQTVSEIQQLRSAVALPLLASLLLAITATERQ